MTIASLGLKVKVKVRVHNTVGATLSEGRFGLSVVITNSLPVYGIK